MVADDGKQLAEDLSKKPAIEPAALNTWYTTVEQPHVTEDQGPVNNAVIHGGRKALQVTAIAPGDDGHLLPAAGLLLRRARRV